MRCKLYEQGDARELQQHRQIVGQMQVTLAVSLLTLLLLMMI
jgi:hypothetical protein